MPRIEDMFWTGLAFLALIGVASFACWAISHV